MLVVPLNIFGVQIVKNIDEPTVVFVDALQTAVNGRISQFDDMKF